MPKSKNMLKLYFIFFTYTSLSIKLYEIKKIENHLIKNTSDISLEFGIKGMIIMFIYS